MRTQIKDQVLDEERALYHLQHADLRNVRFAGPADGESALKEAHDVTLQSCAFSLRYPLWHTTQFRLEDCAMDETARAALWYAADGTVAQSVLHGIKAVRECRNVRLSGCSIVSPEFGWKCDGLTLEGSVLTAEYPFLDSRNLQLQNVELHGKYSFQYAEDVVIEHCNLDTKDAFWHGRNVTVRDSIVKGEYLGWYAENLTLERCRIIGTQPLCYCKSLTLIDCTMEQCDLSFEYSDVSATVRGHIDSVKNPKSGVITADSVGEIIREDAVMPCSGQVVEREA
ncbi:MAG: DUF3737 family protein [Clostridia bacterium]|nr:DUF3737 family protein [Clostridia bacterium]